MNDDNDGITDKDKIELEIMVERITLPQIAETLETLATRERNFLKNPEFSTDDELKEITLWNVAALCAASGKIYQIIQARRERLESEISQDQSEERPVQEEEPPPSSPQS